MSTTDFKPGDKVKYIGLHSPLVDRIGVVEAIWRINGVERLKVQFDNGRLPHWLPASVLVAAVVLPGFQANPPVPSTLIQSLNGPVQAPTPPTKFKVGDRVRLKIPSGPCSLGTVKMVKDSINISVRFDNYRYSTPTDFHSCFGIDEFELVEGGSGLVVPKATGSAICTKCNYKNDYLDPTPGYLCFNCRT